MRSYEERKNRVKGILLKEDIEKMNKNVSRTVAACAGICFALGAFVGMVFPVALSSLVIGLVIGICGVLFIWP